MAVIKWCGMVKQPLMSLYKMKRHDGGPLSLRPYTRNRVQEETASWFGGRHGCCARVGDSFGGLVLLIHRYINCSRGRLKFKCTSYVLFWSFFWGCPIPWVEWMTCHDSYRHFLGFLQSRANSPDPQQWGHGCLWYPQSALEDFGLLGADPK